MNASDRDTLMDTAVVQRQHWPDTDRRSRCCSCKQQPAARSARRMADWAALRADHFPGAAKHAAYLNSAVSGLMSAVSPPHA